MSRKGEKKTQKSVSHPHLRTVELNELKSDDSSGGTFQRLIISRFSLLRIDYFHRVTYIWVFSQEVTTIKKLDESERSAKTRRRWCFLVYVSFRSFDLIHCHNLWEKAREES